VSLSTGTQRHERAVPPETQKGPRADAGPFFCSAPNIGAERPEGMSARAALAFGSDIVR
jgi:hypothetical protein